MSIMRRVRTAPALGRLARCTGAMRFRVFEVFNVFKVFDVFKVLQAFKAFKAFTAFKAMRGFAEALGVMPVLAAVAALVVLPHAAEAGSVAVWKGLGEGGPVGAELDRILGPVSIVVQSGSMEEPSTCPDGSPAPITSVTGSEAVLGAFYSLGIGPVDVGLGVAHVQRKCVGVMEQTLPSSETVQVPVTLLDETATGAAAMVGIAAGEGPLHGEARAIITTEGVLWSARALWRQDRLSAGVGFAGGPAGDWWSGPLIFVGASW